MDGPLPIEDRMIIPILNRYSCPLERALHLLNEDILRYRRLGLDDFGPPATPLGRLFRQAFELNVRNPI